MQTVTFYRYHIVDQDFHFVCELTWINSIMFERGMNIPIFGVSLDKMHIFIKDMHDAFEIYPCYPLKMEDNFTHNTTQISIYGKKKWN